MSIVGVIHEASSQALLCGLLPSVKPVYRGEEVSYDSDKVERCGKEVRVKLSNF